MKKKMKCVIKSTVKENVSLVELIIHNLLSQPVDKNEAKSKNFNQVLNDRKFLINNRKLDFK